MDARVLEIKKLDDRLKIAEKWFDDNADIDSRKWEKSFSLFQELLKKRSVLEYQITNNEESKLW